jgi:acyl carrier protein
VEPEPSLGDIRDGIRDYVLKHHLQGESPASLRDETPLQSSGILDSLALLDLVACLEKHYGIELSASETGFEGFDRIQQMATVVADKQKR